MRRRRWPSAASRYHLLPVHLPRPSPRRLTTLLSPVLALAMAASACSSVGEEAAASVGGTDITSASLEDELDALESAPDYLGAVEQQFQAPLRGEGEGTYDSRFLARLLSLRVYYELIEQELDRRGLAVTDEDREGVREAAVEGAGGPEVFESFPASYQERLVHQRALITKLGEAVTGEGVEEGAARAYYDANRDQLESRCLAHILVGTNDPAQPTGDRTREEARARAAELRADLAAGADFTELASSEANDDTVSAGEGGSLDCITRQTQFDPTFLEAAFAAEVGEVTAPVETQFGYHLILVSSAEVPPFEEVEGQIEQQLAQDGAGAFDEVLRAATCEGEVEVASRYGTWDTSGCEEGGFASVTPPEGPTTTSPPVPGAGGGDPAAPAGG